MRNNRVNKKTGILIVGAYGHLATTLYAGVLALKKKLCDRTGMVTGLNDFLKLNLIEPEDIIFGGWDIRHENLVEKAEDIFYEIRFPDRKAIEKIQGDLESVESDIFPGTSISSGKAIENMDINRQPGTSESSLLSIIDRLKADINLFKKKHNLDTVVVVNLASTEPSLSEKSKDLDEAELNRIIEENDFANIRASVLYTYAAIDTGCSFINFTPSAGALGPGLIEFAERKGVPVMGNDGKTGETLVKSALAPMFACRNLDVLSWEGYNILGNMDGKILDNPDNKATKIESKDRLLSKILGYRPHSRVSIDYVPSLGDWKTAWDFIHFRGFLNTKMSLQFVWQGCDSALAAPLVLDLARLSVFAMENGERGLMKHLACFFKSPVGVSEHNLNEQFNILMAYVGKFQ